MKKRAHMYANAGLMDGEHIHIPRKFAPMIELKQENNTNIITKEIRDERMKERKQQSQPR